MVKFSPGFRIAYWLGLIAVLTWFLTMRIGDAVAGQATVADTFVFAIWVALLLAPLFSEVEFFGVKLKQEVEKAKDEIKREIVSLKTDITSAIEVRTNVSPNIYLAPPPDAQLPSLEVQIKRVLEKLEAARGPQPQAAGIELPDHDVIFLMTIRRDIEVELRRIVRERQLPTGDRPLAGIQLSRLLAQSEVVDPDLLRAIREVYAVCSPAVHGEPVSPAKVAFVRDLAPSLIKTLRAIH